MKLYCVRVKTALGYFFIDSTWVSEELANERRDQLYCAFAFSNATSQFSADIFWQHLTGAKLG